MINNPSFEESSEGWKAWGARVLPANVDVYDLSFFKRVEIEVPRPRLIRWLFGRRYVKEWQRFVVRIYSDDCKNITNVEPRVNGLYDMIQLERVVQNGVPIGYPWAGGDE